MMNDGEQVSLIGELTQGRELANMLKSQLNPIQSKDNCEALVEKIVSTYDKALSFLRPLKRKQPNFASTNRNFKDQQQQCQNKNVLKKRKTLARWSEQVKGCSEKGLEGPLDDGHSWRKYGQKLILGAKFPRAYYRCTHRNTQGCLATKQVQKSDEDSTIFEVTYKGRHSCIKASEVEKEISKPMVQETLTNIGDGLEVETEDLNTNEEIFPFFSFPFTTIESEIVENQFFCDTLMESDLMSCYSSPFLSPTSSESNYFSSPNGFVIATPTSVTNSPFGDPEFTIDQMDFDPTFPFDTLVSFE